MVVVAYTRKILGSKGSGPKVRGEGSPKVDRRQVKQKTRPCDWSHGRFHSQ